MALQAALMAAMFAELLPWLIMRYLGEISYVEDRALRGRTAWAWLCFPGKQNRICARLCVSWAPAVS
jgi:hypothetical protein